MAKRRKGKGKRQRARGYDVAVRAYYGVLDYLSRLSSEPDMHGMDNLAHPSRLRAPALWAHLADARVFVVHPSNYLAWYHEADVHTTEDIAGHGWTGPGDPEPSKDEIAEHVLRVSMAGRKLPIPDPARWPFPRMWITYVSPKEGHTPGITVEQLAARFGPVHSYSRDWTRGELIGQLFTADFPHDNDGTPTAPQPAVFTFLRVDFLRGVEGAKYYVPGMVCDVSYLDGAWLSSYSLDPWTTQALFAYLAEFRRFTTERNPKAPERRVHEQAQRKAGDVRLPIPRPFYALHLRPNVVAEARDGVRRRAGRTWKLDHRIDVRGHERVRVARGPLPMPAKTRAKLQRAGYRVYGVEPCKRYDERRLVERALPPKSASEWLAVKVSWVAHYEKGPEAAPHVPALRILPA
jgi:hypothetical protein